MRTMIITLLALTSCVSTMQLEGAWRSNEERTHAQLRQVEESLTPAQRKLLLGEGFFGNLVKVYANGRMISVFEGQCGAMEAYEVVKRTPGELTVRFTSSEDEAERITIMRIEADAYSLPLPVGAKEVFTRVSLNDVAQEFPCIRQALE